MLVLNEFTVQDEKNDNNKPSASQKSIKGTANSKQITRTQKKIEVGSGTLGE